MNVPHYLQPAQKGLLKTAKTSLLLAKIVVPVTVVLVILEELDLLVRVSAFFQPFLKYFGLPGEAALALFLGFFINIYASMGAIAVLSLSPREVTVIALMILTSHSLLMEAPVLNFTGLSPLRSILLRIVAALLFGYLLNAIYIICGG